MNIVIPMWAVLCFEVAAGALGFFALMAWCDREMGDYDFVTPLLALLGGAIIVLATALVVVVTAWIMSLGATQ